MDSGVQPKALVIVGSQSDVPIVEELLKILEDFKIGYDLRILSAHRTPQQTKDVVISAEENGFSILICAAGLAAHLPGVCAAYTHLPVIGIPLNAGDLQGIDALYSIVMMPPGVPVATVGIGKVGVKNAGVLCAQILSLKFPYLVDKVKFFKQEQQKRVLEADSSLKRRKEF